MLRLGFEELGLHRIIGRIDARNTPSARVLERLGMRREAHFVHNEILKGEWTDEVVYAMLEDEWRRADPGPPRVSQPTAWTVIRDAGGAVTLTYISPREAHVGYALTAAVVLAIAFTAAGAMHVRSELRSVPRPSRVAVRRVVRRLPRVTPGDLCLCGGTVGQNVHRGRRVSWAVRGVAARGPWMAAGSPGADRLRASRAGADRRAERSPQRQGHRGRGQGENREAGVTRRPAAGPPSGRRTAPGPGQYCSGRSRPGRPAGWA